MTQELFKIILFFNLLLCFICTGREKLDQFELNGKSDLLIENRTDSAMAVSIENWYILPWKSQEIDTILSPGDLISFRMITQGHSYFQVKINEHHLQIFSRPGAANQLVLLQDSSQIEFRGRLKPINQFLWLKNKSLGSDWKPRTAITHGDQSFAALINSNDSITQLHQNFLKEHKTELPQWYVAFEAKRLEYLNAHWKLNSLMYRKRMMNRSDSVPENFLQNTVRDLQINDPEMLGNIRYMNFLNDYLGFASDPFYEQAKPSSTTEWLQFYDDHINTINDKLEGEVRDTYLAFSLGLLLERRAYLFRSDWITEIKDQSLRDYLITIHEANPILPEGTEIPYFFLMDKVENTYTPDSFKGKIVYISFWATWCKPCIKEFPEENALVEKYEGKPVQVVNICIDSDKDKWKGYIDKYQLKSKNLFANGNWNEKLKKDYGIQALPHSVLIDWTGKIVMNKCPRVSENADMQISQLLDQLEKQN